MDQAVRLNLDHFFHQFKFKKYDKGRVLIEPNYPPDGIFYLESGVVRRYTISPKGEELNLNIFKANSFFPMSWALNQTENKHYYEALTEVEAFLAPRERVIEFLQSNPEVLLDLLSRIYKGMEGVMLRMEQLMSGDAYSRLVAELLIYGRRFGEDKSGEIQVKLKLTENEIASQTGLTRETVSRNLNLLQKRGLINFKNGQLIIQDLNKLETELN